MKLSEAIRLGSMLKPQARGVFYNCDNKSTCANGAALDAIGALDTDEECSSLNNTRLCEAFPLAAATGHGCPVCGTPQTIGGEFYWVIAHLNDSIHKWTREQIADWVETIEAQHAEPVREAAQIEVPA